MTEDIDIGLLIKHKLREKARSISCLARELGQDSSNLSKSLKNGKHIDVDLLYRISLVLKFDFFAFYSRKLMERKD